MKNYSRQREAILEVLKSTKSHPTAEQVYEAVKEKIPNISLGTVYRNLSSLSKDGEVLCISVGDGHDHFDMDVSSHIHLFCQKCGKITDEYLKNDSALALAKKNGFEATNCVYVIYGVCSDCNNQSLK